MKAPLCIMPAGLYIRCHPMQITSTFDAGNIEVLEIRAPQHATEASASLRIRKDAGGDHLQWFHFRVLGARGKTVTLRIENAGETSYPAGWPDYQACVSHDRVHWGRTETHYDGQSLEIRHACAHDSVYVAYFAPYSLERHADKIASFLGAEAISYERLGATVDGRDMDLLRVGAPAPTRDAQQANSLNRKRVCWIIARQHPGESMAEWLVEGLLDRLTHPDDPVARRLREKAVFYVVPNMNPDGSFRGHLRNNAAGANLNREWAGPSPARSPEVFAVRNKMLETGVDFFLDVHGDEGLPYNFIAGAEGIPRWSDRLASLQATYKQHLCAVSPDFQTNTVTRFPRPEKPTRPLPPIGWPSSLIVWQ